VTESRESSKWQRVNPKLESKTVLSKIKFLMLCFWFTVILVHACFVTSNVFIHFFVNFPVCRVLMCVVATL